MTRLLPILGLIIATVAISVHSVVIRVENLPEKCDYSKCTAPDPTRINVHLVPHTHDDVGWLKTVDQYFYGLRSNIQKAGVQYIIDSVIEELVRNKDRRFIYVETAFFWKWWKEQDQETRDIVHELVKTGQLEFINGGWSMSDEATVQYNSFIDQTTWGLRRLNDTFGKCGVPKVTWQIDPFGHSKELASLFAQMNYDAVFFAREDWQELHFRRQNKTLEHVWQGSEDLGSAGDLFTGMMDFGYGPPQGFNWDLVGGGDEPVIDNKDSEEYNVPHMIEKLVNLAKRYQKSYATKNVMFPMGTDFQYQDAHVYFKNMDKLINHVNAGSKEVKIFYSTPSCYAKALHDSVGHASWTGKADDYFPYASDPHAYWTGYFVSRAALKRFERVGNNVLQACKQVDVLAGNGDALEREITSLREIMGVMQHHDAVAGTEKQHVADDYARNLHAGIEACRDVLQRSYHKLQAKATANLPTIQKQVFCDYLNASSCSATEAGRNFAVNVYNPLGAPLVNKVLRLPVATSGGKFYEVLGPEGKPVPSELVAIPEAVRNLPERKHSTATEELVFQASAPALGLATYFVQVASTRSANSAAEVKGVKISAETKLKAANFEVVFDASGALSKVVLKNGQSVPLSSNFRFYKGAADEKVRASGAYVFRPLTQETFSAGKLVESNLYTKEGGVHEVHQKYDSYVEQVVRVSPTSDQVEFEYIVGPIPVGDHVGKEVVLQYSADLKNGGVFYTDANGRQMVKRQWNARRHLKLNVTEPISGNYYPINSRIMLKDEAKKLVMTVLTDRSQGGTSPQDGVLELMVHRRLLHDDHFGVGEPLNEPGVDGKGLIIRGRHVLQLSTLEEAGKGHREAGREMFLEPILSFVPDVAPYDVFSKSYHTEVSGLTKALPANVHLLTLEQWSGGRLLLRLEHFFQKGEHAELSKPVTLSLKGLFKHFEITAAQELTLAANQDVSALKNRLKFKYTADGPVTEPAETKAFNAQTMEVTLNPMQIRTFAVTVKRN